MSDVPKEDWRHLAQLEKERDAGIGQHDEDEEGKIDEMRLNNE